MKIKILLMSAILIAIFLGSFEISYGKNEQNVKKEILPNGLRLIMNPDSSRDIVSVCLYVDGGVRTENPEVYGISHFIEHLVFRGPSENLEELELRQNFRQYGSFSGYTSADITCYGFTVPTSNFDIALDEFVDGVMNLTIPSSVIEKEREVVTNEIHQRYDIPRIRIWELFNSTALRTHSYAHPVIGYQEIIQNISEDTIREYYRTRYSPDHFVLSIVGDFEPDHMRSRIEGAFGAYEASRQDFERGFIDPPQDRERHAIEEADVNAMHKLMGWRVPGAGSNLSPSFAVLAEILGGGEDSRLYKSLRTELELVDEIRCFPYLRKDIGFLSIYVIAPSENRDQIRNQILHEIAKLRTNPPSSDEIQRAKRRIENSHSFDLQTYWEKAQYYARWAIYENLEQGLKWLELTNKVEVSDIMSLVDEYLHEHNLTWVALVPETEETLEVEPEYCFEDVPVSKAFNRKLDAGETVSGRLTNHAKLILRRDTSSDIIGVVALAGFGQVMESDGQEGISSLISRMLTKGSGGMSAEEIRRKIDELGCNLDISADRDFIKISMEIRKDRIIEGMELLSKIIFEPDFPSDEFERERNNLIAELARRRDDPFTHVNDVFFEKLYGDTPYGYPVQGKSESIEEITVDDLKAFHKTAFAPRSMVIGISGDVNMPEFYPVVDLNLGRFLKNAKPSNDISWDYPIENIPAHFKEAEIIRLPRSQVSFNMGLVGVSADNPDYSSLRLLTRILGLRMFDKYVYELGWSYRMWFFMPTRHSPAPIMYEMGVNPDRFDEARDGLIKAMRDVIETPISEEELDETRNYVIQSLKLAMQKNIDTAYYLAYYEKIGLGFDYMDKMEEIYGQITPSDLQNVASKYFLSDKLKLVAIVPSDD